MGKGITIKFDGLDKLLSSIEKQPEKIQKEAGDTIVNTGLRVEKRAKSNAPVDTGYLKAHIKSERTGTLSADITSSAEYSIYNEFGTRKMSPHPYMRPAIKMEEPFLYQKLDNLLKKGLL